MDDQSILPSKKSTLPVIVLILVGISGLYLLLNSAFKLFVSADVAAKVSAANHKVREIDLAVIKFADAHNDTYPKFSKGVEMADAIKPYLADPTLYAIAEACVWNTKLSGRNLNELNDPSGTWVLYGQHLFGLKGNMVGYTDGHTRELPDGEVAKLTSQGEDLFRTHEP